MSAASTHATMASADAPARSRRTTARRLLLAAAGRGGPGHRRSELHAVATPGRDSRGLRLDPALSVLPEAVFRPRAKACPSTPTPTQAGRGDHRTRDRD